MKEPIVRRHAKFLDAGVSGYLDKLARGYWRDTFHVRGGRVVYRWVWPSL